MPENRGNVEDAQLSAAYASLRTNGAGRVTGAQYSAVFPEETLLFREKTHNVAGLQIADLVAADQKAETLQRYERPTASPLGPFGRRLNQAIQHMVNQWGQYLLE